MAIFTAGAFGVDMDQLNVAAAAAGSINGASAGGLTVQGGFDAIIFTGSGLQYGPSGAPSTGVITAIQGVSFGSTAYTLTGLNISAAPLFFQIGVGDSAGVKTALLGGSDSIQGSSSQDRLRGYGGDDTMQGGEGGDILDGGDGNDQVFGGAGNDLIVDPGGSNYLRGDEGDDNILGGVGFDDINGNMGNDTASGGVGNDWVVGGKDQDMLFGDDGDDLVYGNLGNDTCDGGSGADIIRGGQGNDVLVGGAGNDYVSGDRGDDTISGGSGADNFHSFGEAGIDRVLDFNSVQGDRIWLDLGTTYTVAQTGADTIISMGGGGMMILVGVPMSSLTSTSIFLA